MNEKGTYEQAVSLLTSQGKFYINLGLERVQGMLKLMGCPHKNMKFIHVAGTNGKGSVCAMLSAILKSAGFKAALFTSPHVYEYTERIKINDEEISKEIFAQKIFEIVELAEKNQIHLTEFEILTVLAFDYFAENKVDIVILETGLGGRLDATNVVEQNFCSVITHIDFDHTERLGDTIEKISEEKAGIIKQGCPVVVAQDNPGFGIIRKMAKEKKAKFFPVSLAKQGIEQGENLSLKGSYQKENLALVLKVIDLLREGGWEISDKDIKNGLKQVKHPCRFEYLKDKNLLIDGAHNPNGARVLRESLEEYFPNQNYRFVFGCLKNKNYSEMMKSLFRKGDEIYFYHFDNENSASFEELQNKCEFSAKYFEKWTKSDKLTVICGSFYMIKELITKIGIK